MAAPGAAPPSGRRLLLSQWDPREVASVLAGVVGALTPRERRLEPLQLRVLEAICAELAGGPIDVDRVQEIGPDEMAAAVPDPELRSKAVHLMVTLELLLHPVPADVAAEVARYARTLQVEEPAVREARLLAHDQLALMYACIQRNSWYSAETRREIGRGRLFELVASKLAYYALQESPDLADRWRALGDLPEGTWGRAVHTFYLAHGFPFPGELHGIYEVGARHDWVHVLTDYGTTPEGEIDVFAFIAAAMPDPKGFILLVTTLGIFQNGSIHHMFGKPIPTAGTDALEAPAAPQRLAESLRRGAACGVDVLDMDHFAHAAEPLEEVRRRLRVDPRRS